MNTIRPALYPFQQDAKNAAMDAWRAGLQRVLLAIPTGGGKTLIAAHIVAKGTAVGRRVLLLAHTEELVDQLASTVRGMTSVETVGIVRAEHDETDAQVICGSVQTLRNPQRLERVGTFNLIVVDECHHAAAQSYRDILTALGAFDPNGPRVLGLTATPDRGDGQGLDSVFEEIVYSIDILRLIELGRLANVRAKRIMVDRLHLDTVTRRGGDWVDGALGDAMIEAVAPSQIAQAIQTYAPDRRTIVFTPDVKTARRAADAINALGIRAESIDGTTPPDERRLIIDAVRSGELQVICNCLLLIEGFDCPELTCAVMCRPTSSRPLYQQAVGRVLRASPGKDHALILDMAGVTQRHSIQGAVSLLGEEFVGAEIRDGESLTQAAKRHEEEQAAQLGRLVAIDVEVFARSDLSWTPSPDGFMVLPGFRKGSDLRGFAIRQTAPDRCEIYQLREAGYDYHAKRVLRGLPTKLAMQRAEEMASAAELTAGARKGSAWRDEPASPGQRKKLWAMGYRSPKNLNAVRTKGEAANLISCMQADKAITALMQRDADEEAA